MGIGDTVQPGTLNFYLGNAYVVSSDSIGQNFNPELINEPTKITELVHILGYISIRDIKYQY